MTLLICYCVRTKNLLFTCIFAVARLFLRCIFIFWIKLQHFEFCGQYLYLFVLVWLVVSQIRETSRVVCSPLIDNKCPITFVENVEVNRFYTHLETYTSRHARTTAASINKNYARMCLKCLISMDSRSLHQKKMSVSSCFDFHYTYAL